MVALALESANPAQQEQLRSRLGDPHLDADGVTVLRDVIAATGAVDRVEQLIDERVSAALTANDSATIDPEARAALVDLAAARRCPARRPLRRSAVRRSRRLR